jgi:cell wall-associated NlpC family hydrolase
MLQAALAQIGKPYVWGATGPNAFDCSGLVVYAWRQAGYQLTVRTSEEMYNLALPVPAGSEQPGDLIFSQFGEDGIPGPGHVQIVVTKGTLVEAARTGIPVRKTGYSYPAGTTFGRLPASAMTQTTG